MLLISLILSALLLLAANVLAWRSHQTGSAWIILTSLGFLVVPLLGMCLFPALSIQALLLCLAAVVWQVSGRGPAFFLWLSCGATLLSYGVSGVLAVQSEREYARLRARHPYESMEARLPLPQIVPGGASLLPAASQRLSRLEENFPDHTRGDRRSQLRMLHEHAVALFINSPGFGVARMPMPSEWGLAVGLRRKPVPPQPESGLTSTWSPGELGSRDAGDEPGLSDLLDDSILDFVNPRGFGYLKDRRHVAGFETHRFGEVPGPVKHWKVQTLELVSLLLHDEPQVYDSPQLPEMSRLRGVPTRPLDRFESLGMDALRQGDDFFATQGDEGVRMLGAVRSIKQCVDCHGGERGALLGAFSYTLRSDEP